MKGRALVIVALVGLGLFAAALWYFQTYAYYRDLEAEPMILGQYPVEEWRGIDASSSPLKKRVCLTVSGTSAAQITQSEPAISGVEPLVAPGWFDCFDAKNLSRDLAEGRATAHLVEREVFDGIHEYLAVYPDGRAYIWRQLDPRYDTQ